MPEFIELEVVIKEIYAHGFCTVILDSIVEVKGVS